MPNISDALGVFQSDLIIKSAIMTGLADMRTNPALLDYALASLKKDALTQKNYGQQDIASARKWFENTQIEVTMDTRLDEVKLPCISIKLENSNETENTLGDVHYNSLEWMDEPWPNLAPPFSPISYDAVTGIMVVPTSVTNIVSLDTTLVVLDSDGNSYPVVETFNDQTMGLAPGTAANFNNAILRSAKPAMVRHMESAAFHETYNLGCHVQGEPIFLTYLHSIVVFILLRYKQALFELRGFEASSFSSSTFARNEFFESEPVYSRYITLTGIVRQYWPKQILPTISTTTIQTRIDDVGSLQLTGDPVLDGYNDPATVSWIGDQDALTVKLPPPNGPNPDVPIPVIIPPDVGPPEGPDPESDLPLIGQNSWPVKDDSWE